MNCSEQLTNQTIASLPTLKNEICWYGLFGMDFLCWQPVWTWVVRTFLLTSLRVPWSYPSSHLIISLMITRMSSSQHWYLLSHLYRDIIMEKSVSISLYYYCSDQDQMTCILYYTVASTIRNISRAALVEGRQTNKTPYRDFFKTVLRLLEFPYAISFSLLSWLRQVFRH